MEEPAGGIEISEAFATKFVENVTEMSKIFKDTHPMMSSMQEQADEMNKKLQDRERGNVPKEGAKQEEGKAGEAPKKVSGC